MRKGSVGTKSEILFQLWIDIKIKPPNNALQADLRSGLAFRSPLTPAAERGRSLAFMVAITDLTRSLWMFVRGHTPVTEFENWVYGTPELQDFLGKELYLQLIGTDFRNRWESVHIKDAIEHFLEFLPRDCDCITWPDLGRVPVTYETAWVSFARNFVTLRTRTPLEAVRCTKCGAHWLIAIDSIYDEYILCQLKPVEVEEILTKGKWPSTFDKNKNLFH